MSKLIRKLKNRQIAEDKRDMFVKRETIEELMLVPLCSFLADKCTINKTKMENKRQQSTKKV